MADAGVPINYMDRTRHYYRALGYTRDYTWATFGDVPFFQLAKPPPMTLRFDIPIDCIPQSVGYLRVSRGQSVTLL